MGYKTDAAVGARSENVTVSMRRAVSSFLCLGLAWPQQWRLCWCLLPAHLCPRWCLRLRQWTAPQWRLRQAHTCRRWCLYLRQWTAPPWRLRQAHTCHRRCLYLRRGMAPQWRLRLQTHLHLRHGHTRQ